MPYEGMCVLIAELGFRAGYHHFQHARRQVQDIFGNNWSAATVESDDGKGCVRVICERSAHAVGAARSKRMQRERDLAQAMGDLKATDSHMKVTRDPVQRAQLLEKCERIALKKAELEREIAECREIEAQKGDDTWMIPLDAARLTFNIVVGDR